MPSAGHQLEFPISESWVFVEQIAERLDVTRDSTYCWIDRKGLPAHRLGRFWKFKVSEGDERGCAGGADGHKEQE